MAVMSIRFSDKEKKLLNFILSFKDNGNMCKFTLDDYKKFVNFSRELSQAAVMKQLRDDLDNITSILIQYKEKNKGQGTFHIFNGYDVFKGKITMIVSQSYFYYLRHSDEYDWHRGKAKTVFI